jgi:hypothetical protein
MTASRVQIVPAHLDRTNVEWNPTTVQVREVLVDPASQMDSLDRRVRALAQQSDMTPEPSR